MGLIGNLHSLSASTCEAFARLDSSYWPRGDDPEPFSCGLDKAWHLLHFLLTGAAQASDHPLAILYERGVQLEAVSEYCCAVSPGEMEAFHAALDAETPASLWTRLDWGAMVADEVYGAQAGDDPERAFVYAAFFLPDLRVFARRCADEGCGALVVIS